MFVESQLLMITEVAVALAGFAGVVASFQFTGEARPSRGNVLALSVMILVSLNVALFSAIPLMIGNFGVSTDSVWMASSTLFGISYVYSIPGVWSRLKKVRVRSWTARGSFVLLMVLNITATAALFLSAADFLLPRGPGVYFAALLFPLVISGYMFVRLVVRPLWKSIHMREATQAITTE